MKHQDVTMDTWCSLSNKGSLPGSPATPPKTHLESSVQSMCVVSSYGPK